MIIDEDNYLAHYGILRRSGRYPWGSGENSGTQTGRNKKFLDYIEDMKAKGLSEAEIAAGVGISIATLRSAKTYAKAEQKASQITFAQRLSDKGVSNPEIAKRMGLPGESSVRALLAPGARDKYDNLVSISEMIKSEVGDNNIVDVGTGVETQLKISRQKLDTALFMLAEQGYEVHTVPVPQVVGSFNTKTKVVVPPGVTQKDAWRRQLEIKHISTYSDDSGRNFAKDHPLVSVDPSRVKVRYAEEGGGNADGVIYVRPGVKDLSLGKARYAQVRIKIGEDHFLKGMALYKDDLPAGVDLLFNTNKTDTGNKLDAMKKLKKDQELPFESVTRPIVLDLSAPTERVESAMNLVYEEGDWMNWTDSLSSQVLSKQRPSLAKEQLDKALNRAEDNLNEILELTNPAVRKKLLDNFADTADAAAVKLNAAALPRQNWKVILPIESLKPNEVYAPTFDNGERVVLIRYPHGGTFEIPELKVNNRHPESRRMLADAIDAIGIHPSVAVRLSGADFDGDTVLVIPDAKGKITITPALSGLKDFDPQRTYPPFDGMKTIDGGRWNAKTGEVEFEEGKVSNDQKQNEMGKISNLITDMTIRRAPHDEIAKAVRHSMVVIDAEKHKLNFKQSAIDNSISHLTAKYQTAYRDNKRPGASTLISRRKSTVTIPQLKGLPKFPQGAPIDPETGRKIQVETGRTERRRDGTVRVVTERYKKLELTEDVHTLSSGTRIEGLYADYSNKQKALANKARLESIKTPRTEWNTSAKYAYAKEVASLDSKLTIAKRNRTLERHATVIAQAAIKAKRDANPNLDGDSLKKIRFQEMDKARLRVKLDQRKIDFTDREWEAIQAGAISNNKLNQLLAKADMNRVRELATPRTTLLMTASKTQQAKSLMNQGYTRAEVASRLGVSVSTLDRSMEV